MDNKMKKLIASLTLVSCLLCLSTKAQDTNTVPVLPPPVNTFLNFVGTLTNWAIAPYVTYAQSTKEMGGGIAALVNITPYAASGLRLDYLGKKLWMPSINIQLQMPIHISGQLDVIPFALSGLATPLGGSAKDNGTAQAIFGAGLAVKFSKNIYVAWDYEKWTNYPGNQHRVAFIWRF